MQGREPTLGDGRYNIRRELGRGTMGVVYEAEDTVLARTVAVKTIDLALTADEGSSSEFEQRFFTEARVAARLSHPGIVVCHDVGKDASSGKLFIVFEYLKGQTLADRAALGPMDWRDALDVVVQVARALHHTHAHGVVHRDLKPANIMLLSPATTGASSAGAKGAVKIMDFGVARLESLERRLTRTGQFFGSPLYMSPEQALGQPSDGRSDIFSLGSVLCTLLLHRPWFSASSVPGIVRRIVHDEPPSLSSLRPDLPPSLDAVVTMALAKRQEDRYATAADMADDLEDVLAGRTPQHATPGASAPLARAAGQDSLLADMATPIGGRRESLASDPLVSLLDESPLPEAATLPGAATATLAPQGTATVGATTVVTIGSHRRWLAPALVLVLAGLAASALFSWRRSFVGEPEPVPTPTAPVVSEAPPTSVPVSAPTPEPTAPATPAAIAPAPTAPATSASAAALLQPRSLAPTATPIVASPPTTTNTADPAPRHADAPAASEAARSRIRLSVEHPFENGRLIVWVDGVLVYETKLQATGSKKIVAFTVREGHAEKVLDVEPGRHEVRVEVTWDQGRRASAKVVDVAASSTGLLEVRVGRMSKDLSLTWSRLAKD